MALNVKDAIDTDTGEKVYILRKTEGDYVDGEWVDGEEQTIKALASIQQPTKQQLELVTGLERNSDTKSFYINKYVRTTDDYDELEADIILWGVREYRAMKLGEWESYGYNIVVGVRIK